MNFLKFLKLDFKNPLKLLTQLLPLFEDRLEHEFELYFDKRVTKNRRAELVTEFRKLADCLERDNDFEAAKVLARVVKGIKI